MSLKLMSAVIPASLIQHKQEDSSKLLNQLLECVQDCQKRFGGKTELATEFDSCVAALCLTLEAVFLHGLRAKPQEVQQISTLKQVSEIVSNSLHLGNETPSFWPFVNKHLTKHEQERYLVLKHVWTDTGRGRAWLRSSLNERSLERYFHIVLSNDELLKSHYEDWALLCDQEKNSMLPNMAAGLNSILFAVSIDRPELNSSSSTQHIQKFKTKAEPIIEAPIPETESLPKEKRKKKRVARQFISFDDDDSVLSSSVPSSSGSIKSETQSNKDNQSLSDLPEEEPSSHETMDKPKRKLSVENSGTRDSFSKSLEGPLTPITPASVGELTPVFVESPKHLDSTTSDEAVEVSTDISAVLTVVENKNREEVGKLQEKIETLTKENAILKEQLKKYVSAIQMLEIRDENLESTLEELQIGQQQPNYKYEAQFFEKKLVQVAEMHAELMDFNVMLQQALGQKDSHIQRLTCELEELRGPVPTDDLLLESRGHVNVWIPSAFLTGSGSDSHHVYQIYLRAGSDEWNIYRRYAQFYALHTDLKKLDPVISTFDFPPKKSIGKKDSSLVEDRRKRLQVYLRRVIQHWPELAHCNSRFLLEQHLAFFKDQKEEDAKKEKKGLFKSRKSNSSVGTDNHYTGL